MKEKSKFLMCECYSHALFIEKYEHDEEVSISLFERAFNNRVLSWKERIRWCLHILKTGLPWTDYVLLSKENQKSLKEFLQDCETS